MGDVPATWAYAELLETLAGYKPQTYIKVGIREFLAWFRDYFTKCYFLTRSLRFLP